MIKKIRGFTIVELQVASAIAIFMLTATIGLYIFYWHFFSIGTNILDIYSNSRVAMGHFAKDIRCAAQIAPSHVFGGTYGTYTTSDNCLVLQVPSVNSTGSTMSSHYDYLAYKVEGTNLYKLVDADSVSSRYISGKNPDKRRIAQCCQSLSFKFDGNTFAQTPNLSTVNTVSISLPLNKPSISLADMSGTGHTIENPTSTTTIRLRNK